MLQTGSATIEALRRLRELGISIALDDFGIGYSSLTSLEQLPINRVKLDRMLVEGVDSNPRSAAIVRSIVTLCHGLGLEVVAEGVERSRPARVPGPLRPRSPCRATCWPTRWRPPPPPKKPKPPPPAPALSWPANPAPPLALVSHPQTPPNPTRRQYSRRSGQGSFGDALRSRCFKYASLARTPTSA